MMNKKKNVDVFSEWETKTLEMIQTNKLNEQNATEIVNFIKQFCSKQELDPPYQNETDEFINSFLPLVIKSISELRTYEKINVNYYISILSNIIILLQNIIVSNYEQFINSARILIENPNLPFYNLFFNQTILASSLYVKLRQIFTKQNSLKNIYMLIDSDSNIPLTKFLEIVEIILPINNYFEPSEISDFSINLSKRISKIAMQQDIKEINESIISELFQTLLKYETLSNLVKTQMYEIQAKIYVKIAQSDILTKQFAALETIKNICFIYPDNISPILARERLIDSLLKTDLHVKLVDSLMTIIMIMNENKCVTKSQFMEIWKKVIEQSQSTFPAFMAGLRRVSKQMFQTDPMLQVIVETNEYPDSIFQYLQILSVRCASMQTKKDVFNALYKLYKETPDRAPESQRLLIKTIGKFVCSDDVEFCNEQQKLCLENIENDQDVALSLNILNYTFRNASSAEARFYFNSIIKKIDKDSVEYLNLLCKIMRKFDKPLSGEEFNSLKEITFEMVKDHPEKVVSFYKSVLDEEASMVPLLDQNMKQEILMFFCNLPYSTKSFEFIQFIYDQFNSNFYNSYIGIEYIWSYLFKTNRTEVANVLIKKYKEMRDPNNSSFFIQMSSQDFCSTGSLYALEKFIHISEDGIDFQPGPNKFFLQDDYLTVILIGDISYTIKVLKDISFEGFIRKISQITNVDSSQIRINENGNLMTNNYFFLYNEIKITVKINSNNQPIAVTQYVYPSQILTNPEYCEKLFNIMIDSDCDLALMALRILNLLPTLSDQLLEINEDIIWEEFLCIDMPYLLIYRINTIANLISKEPDKYIPLFYPSGMVALLNIVVNVALSIFPDTDSLLTLLKISDFLLEFQPASQYKSEILEELKDSVPTLLQCIQTTANNENNSVILDYLINFLSKFQIAASFPEFNGLVKTVMFNKIQSIRSRICELVNRINPVEKKEELIIPLLDESKNDRCNEYFSVLVSIAKETNHPNDLLDQIIKALYVNFTLPKHGTILNVLLFISPPLEYLHGLFKTLNSLISRVKEIPNMKKLFEFIQNEIIFSPYKYYMPTYEVFSIFLYLLDKDSSFYNILRPIIDTCKEFRLNQSTDNFVLSTTKRNRGIRNMGATCYINSSIQQLYNITKFKKQILLADINTNDWCFEFQYVFTKLFLFPSEYIDISNFLKTWKGIDNNIINVHQQQDSVEFLQLLLDRINKEIPGISSMFSGIIEHKTFYEDNEISTNDEEFIIFPLEVKNQESITTSLNAFLDPDKFEYYLDGKGKVNATRFHKVKKAPEILIIQLKRFEYNLKTTEREKINSKFNFSHELDFSPVMANSLSTMYELCGVVQHTGTANGGHYFSDAKRDDGGWLCFNDTSVYKVNGESLLDEAAGGCEEISMYNNEVGYNQRKVIDKTCNAYLLFYKMKNSSMTEPNDLLNSSSIEEFTLSTDFNDGNENEAEEISFDCPGINSKLIKRLLPEIREVILRSVCNTPQFSQLVMKICLESKDGEFLYSHLTNCLRMVSDQNSRNKLIDECTNICSSNHQFADFLLKQENDFIEFSIRNSNFGIRQDFNRLIDVALLYATSEGKTHFYNYALSQIANNAFLFISNWDSIESFFKLFVKSFPEKINSLSLVDGLLNFVINGPGEYDKKFRADQIYNKVNLSIPLDLIIKYTDDSDTQSQAIAFAQIIDSQCLVQMANSPYHSGSFYKLLTHLIKSPENQKYFIEYINNADQSFSIPALSSLFFIILSIDNQQLIDNFFNLLSQRNTSAITLFFSNLMQIPIEQSSSIIKCSNIWIKKFLISKEYNLRKSVENLLVSLLRQFPFPAVGKVENADISLIEIVFQNLIDTIPILDKLLDKMIGQKVPQDNFYPTNEFFRLLIWSTISGGFTERIDVNLFLSKVKYYGKNELYIPQYHVFNFLVEIYGTKIFDYTSISKFLSALEGNMFVDVFSRLTTIMPIKCNDYLNSIFFQYVLRDGFHASEEKFDGPAIFNKFKNPENLILISNQLFSSVVFDRNIKNRSVPYLQFCWRLFKEHPQAYEPFYNSEYHLVIWDLVVRQSNEERPFAKLLAYFNFAYEKENRNRKAFLKLKTDKLLERYEDPDTYFGTTSYAHMKFHYLIDRIQRKDHPKHPGSGGLCHLLRSFIKLSSKPMTRFFTRLEKLSNPLMQNAAPVKPIAMLVCDICTSMEPSKKVDNVFLNEFLALELIDTKSFKAAECFFSAFNVYFNGKSISKDFNVAFKAKFLNSNNIKIFSNSFVNLMLGGKKLLYEEKDFIRMREKTQSLIAGEINSLTVNVGNTANFIATNCEFLSIAYTFVEQLTKILNDTKPNHKIPQNVLQQFISILNDFQLEKETSELLAYTT